MIQPVIDIANDLAMCLVGQMWVSPNTPYYYRTKAMSLSPGSAFLYRSKRLYENTSFGGDEPRNEFSLRPEQAWLGEHVRAGILVSPLTKWRPYRSARLLRYGDTPLRIRRVPPRADRSLTKSFPRPGVLEPDGQVSASQRRLRK